MSPDNTPGETRELKAIAVFELVTQKLKNDFLSRPKSLAELELRYEQIADDLDDALKVKTYQEIIKDLFTTQHRTVLQNKKLTAE
jgi:hypothetical protein